jgi:hypothetical protein
MGFKLLQRPMSCFAAGVGVAVADRLASAEGLDNTTVAARLGCSAMTVGAHYPD